MSLSRSVALASLIVLLAASTAAAQRIPDSTKVTAKNNGEIRGHVVDVTTKAPIGNATVEVTASTASAPAARVSSGADGSFRIPKLKPGRYRVRIVAVGYTPKDLPPVEVNAAAPGAELGAVALTVAPLQLQSVTVVGNKRNVVLAPDRNTYVVRDLPTTRGGNALDVLRNVPAVDVDIDNVVSLRGSSGVVVQINGRPSPLKQPQLGNFLAQLPADMVDKVEVIPNPSARDDPTGIAGIINLVMKKESDAGSSGGVTVGGGTTGQATIGGNLGYQREPWSLYGSYGFLRDRRPRNEALFRENRYVDPLTYLEESGSRLQLPLAHTFTGNAAYNLSKHDELSADIVFSMRNQDDSYNILYSDLNAARAVTGRSDRLTHVKQQQRDMESSLAFKHAFAEKGHKLSGEYRLVGEREGGPGDIAAHAFAPDGTLIAPEDLENQTGWERPNENSFKVDYVRPLSAHLRFETGYKGLLQRFHTTLDTNVMDPALSAFVPDSSRISDFTFRQLVNAGYGMFSAQRGQFQFQGGVRVERATTRFELRTRPGTYDNPYNSVFPSALVLYNIDDAHQVKLSYSTRIRRPDETDQLDPTPRYSDPLNLFRGNPYLKPEYIRALELGLQRSDDHTTVQVTPFFRRTLDAVRTIRTIDNSGVTTRTYANVSTADAYGTDVTISLTDSRVSGFVGASAFRQVSNASNLGTGLSVRTFGWTARTNASFRATSKLDVQTQVSYQAPMTVEQGRNASQTRVTFAARQKLMNDRIGVTLRVMDPFNTSREKSITNDPRFYQVSDRKRVIRGVQLGVNWLFGKPPKEDEPILANPGGQL